MGTLEFVVTASSERQYVPSHRRGEARAPNLRAWSIRQADVADVTGQAREDYERELRISALGQLLESAAATPLWRRICKHAIYVEIKARSLDQRLVMELALREACRV
ncbi:hypothetical protein KTD55_15335 [Burkholderia gladioli]|uniref:hypothetical protein n=1 Tax=Burkholderia gladioli TaxID=28095 RepID=UPI001C22A744|nr:hypothetical protein [Burkholderia gladioli]MBU9215430.1 hypothetical protein [Burkholderia gladioli]MDN7724979.1 hypothetical protein [Burkholderia gladioli]